MTNLQESSAANVASTNLLNLNRVTSSLAISQNQDGRLEAFVIDTDDNIHHAWQNTPNSEDSSDWQSLSNATAKSLTVTHNQDGRLEVFTIGNDKKVYHARQTTANGKDWSQL